jgi:hypothetical protein
VQPLCMISSRPKKNPKNVSLSHTELGVPQPLEIPMQMFTHPSAPAMQAPSQESSAPGGHTTPWTIAYACCFPTSGNNNGKVFVRKREMVCDRSIAGVSEIIQAASHALTSFQQRRCEFLKHGTIWKEYSHWNAAYVRGTVLVRGGCCSSRIHRRGTSVQRTSSRCGRLGACGYGRRRDL